MKQLFLVVLLGAWAMVIRAQQADESLLVASIERTTCYGKCPYYEAKVYSNGLVIYHGKKDVALLGKHQAIIPPEKLEALNQKAKTIGYFDLNDKYPLKGLGIIDFPVCITSLQTENQKKIIYNRNDSPQSLVEYQEFFDETLEALEWTKIVE